MGYFPVRYDPRVVIYERKMFIRLATVSCKSKMIAFVFSNYLSYQLKKEMKGRPGMREKRHGIFGDFCRCLLI